MWLMLFIYALIYLLVAVVIGREMNVSDFSQDVLDQGVRFGVEYTGKHCNVS